MHVSNFCSIPVSRHVHRQSNQKFRTRSSTRIRRIFFNFVIYIHICTCASPIDKRIRNYLISPDILTHKPLVKFIITLVARTKLSNSIVNILCISSFCWRCLWSYYLCWTISGLEWMQKIKIRFSNVLRKIKTFICNILNQ